MGNLIGNDSECPVSFEDLEGWLKAAEIWAIIVAVFGGLGNLVTIAAVLPQLIQARRSANGNFRVHNMSFSSSSNRNTGRPWTPLLRIEGDTILLFHLIVCDLLYCVVNLPITARVYHLSLIHEKPDEWLCLSSALFRYANAIAEWMTLGLLMLERCIDLERLRTDRLFRPKIALISIVIIWCFSISVPMIVHKISSGDFIKGIAGYSNCTLKCDFADDSVKVIFYIFETMIPSILMTFGCFSIIFQIWRHRMNLKNLGMPEELVRQRTMELMRSTSVLLGLLILYLTCVIPICVTNMYNLNYLTKRYNLNYPTKRSEKVGIFVYMIYWIQYGINFLVYACGNPKIRKAYRQLPVLLKEKLINLIGTKDYQNHNLTPGSFRIGPAVISITAFENNLKNELIQGMSKDKPVQKNKHISWPIVPSAPKDTLDVKEKFGTYSSGMSWVSSNTTLESTLISKSRTDISGYSLSQIKSVLLENSLTLPRYSISKSNDI